MGPSTLNIVHFTYSTNASLLKMLKATSYVVDSTYPGLQCSGNRYLQTGLRVYARWPIHCLTGCMLSLLSGHSHFRNNQNCILTLCGVEGMCGSHSSSVETTTVTMQTLGSKKLRSENTNKLSLQKSVTRVYSIQTDWPVVVTGNCGVGYYIYKINRRKWLEETFTVHLVRS